MKMKYLWLAGSLVLALQLPCLADLNDTLTTESEDKGFSGKVVETTNAANYTYVQVDTGSKKVWAATTEFAVKVGDPVVVGAGVPMNNYHSKTLNRDFDLVYFTGSITVGTNGVSLVLPPGHPALTSGMSATLPAGHPSLTGQTPSPNLDLTGIKRAEGGKTIQEIFAAKSKLAGKPVAVRGKVVKYNAMIMAKNWLHIRDGSGSEDEKDNDLTVTTTTPAKLGDTVLVTGNVSTNRDFGAGYKYTVIIEDATVTVE